MAFKGLKKLIGRNERTIETLVENFQNNLVNGRNSGKVRGHFSSYISVEEWYKVVDASKFGNKSKSLVVCNK